MVTEKYVMFLNFLIMLHYLMQNKTVSHCKISVYVSIATASKCYLKTPFYVFIVENNF